MRVVGGFGGGPSTKLRDRGVGVAALGPLAWVAGTTTAAASAAATGTAAVAGAVIRGGLPGVVATPSGAEGRGGRAGALFVVVAASVGTGWPAAAASLSATTRSWLRSMTPLT
jgi:hypothetical protein